MAETGKIEIGTSTLNITPTFSNATKTSMVEIPTITISLSQVISQSPLKIQLTSEQAAIMENDEYSFVRIDATALGTGKITINKAYDMLNDIYNGTAVAATFENDFTPVGAQAFLFVYDPTTKIVHESLISIY